MELAHGRSQEQFNPDPNITISGALIYHTTLWYCADEWIQDLGLDLKVFSC